MRSVKNVLGWLIVVSTFVLTASPPWASSSQKHTSAIDSKTKAADEVARGLIKELGVTMWTEMKKGGPSGAIPVCTEVAPKIANRLSRENGWRVTRIGTRVRNPLLGMPDAWEQEVLKQFSTRANEGESFSDMIHSNIVSEPSGQYFRFMKPIGVQPRCLLCHGAPEEIPSDIRTMLKKHYPHDAATGYKVGDLRGAVSIKYLVNGQGKDAVSNP